MTVATLAPCTPWAVSLDACSDLPGYTEANPTDLTNITTAAQNWMYQQTGRRFTGTCTVEIVPLGADDWSCWSRTRYDRLDLYDFLGQHVENLAVTGVVIGDDSTPTVEGTDWAFIGGRYLVPLKDGLLWPWPLQDPNRPAGHADTWRIEATSGYAPNGLVLVAANALACDILKSFLGLPCEIPKNALSVSRNGVTFTLEPGWKGLPEVAAALEAYPKRRRRRRRLYRLDNIASTNASRT